MGNRLGSNRRHGLSRSASDHSFQRLWPRTSRRRRSVNSLTDPYLASRTTWPVPRTEAIFLPEYTVNPRSGETEYKILHQINKGAYGEVLKVQRQSDKKFFAMKVMSKQEVIRSDAVKQCRDEACIQRMVGHHAFIVQIYKTWQNKVHLHIAPEVLHEDPYFHSIDWWSLGILMYTLLMGSYPIKGASNHHLMCSKVIHMDYALPEPISAEANQLVKQLLCQDPQGRLQSLKNFKEQSFLKSLSFEQLQKRKLHPKNFLKRKLPCTLARKVRSGKKFICENSSKELNIENFDWLRVTAL